MRDHHVSHADVRRLHNRYAACVGGFRCPYDPTPRDRRLAGYRAVRHALRVALRVAVRDGLDG